MQERDFADLPITNADSHTARGYDAYVNAFVSYGNDLRNLFDIAERAPAAPLINAHAAALHLAFEGAEGWQSAAPFLQRMQEHQRHGNEREQLFCGAVEAWSELKFERALDLLDELTVRWPADFCAIKWGQYHAFNRGDQDALLRFGERVRIVHEGAPYAHGLIAFALEQNHRLAEAEEEGLRAAEICIGDAWAHHAVAHVMETEGRAKDGERWLNHCAHTWAEKGVFIRDHNWWHAALFQLALGRSEDALQIYDSYLWGEWPEFPQEQIGAVSMLWRLELRGAEVGDRWTPVVEQARARAGEHLFPFHDMHYLYALARAGNPGEAARFIDTMKAKADASSDRVWRDVALPVAKAIHHYVAGDYLDAYELLNPVMDDLHLIGGSHAQRHLFAETLAACKSENMQRGDEGATSRV